MQGKIITLVGILALVALSAGGTLAQSPSLPKDDAPGAVLAPEDTVAPAISYQGRLVNPATGEPLSGTYDLEFSFLTASSGGFQIGPATTRSSQAISDGLYSTQLDVDPVAITGQELWLQIAVRKAGTTTWEILSPRVQVLPIVYALTLRPGARIEASLGRPQSIIAATNTSHGFGLRGESRDPGGYGIYGYNGNPSWAYGAGVIGSVLASGYGVVGSTDSGHGVGVQGGSGDGYGIRGYSNTGWGGYFTSHHGYGVRVSTYGTDIYDHAGYFTADWGYGVYATSEHNFGVRGEGRVGVIGYGENGGVTGSATNGDGVYGYSDNWTGVYGSSGNYNGVGGGTWRSDGNYGLYTYDNLYSQNYHLAGAIMQVVQNGDTETLERGDLVAIAGLDVSLAGGAPTIRVRKVREANSTAVIGVVASSYSAEWLKSEWLKGTRSDPAKAQAREKPIPLSGPGPVAPGEYLLVVVQGPAQVKASAVGGAIQPGDLLSSAGQVGYAAKSAMLTVEGVRTAVPGTVLGKALEPYAGQELIYVFVTLQ